VFPANVTTHLNRYSMDLQKLVVTYWLDLLKQYSSIIICYIKHTTFGFTPVFTAMDYHQRHQLDLKQLLLQLRLYNLQGLLCFTQ
jgi:hypothetical protein